MNFQGRRKDQYKNSAKFAWYSVIGMIIILILFTLSTKYANNEKAHDKDCDRKETVK